MQTQKVEKWFTEEQELINPHPQIDFNNLDPTDNIIAPIDLIDLSFAIGTLKKKSPGESGIGKEMIKHLPLHFLKQLLYLYNANLASGYMPECFKSAITVLIPKKEDTKDPKGFRPIALLEVLAKVYEIIVYRRLKWHLEDNGLLDKSQFGFRAGRSTHHVVNLLLNHIHTNRRRKRDVLMLSTDVEKAFDTVWKEGLIYKIFRAIKFNLPTLICKSIASYLTNRTIKIKYNNLISTPFTPEAGVPQGSVLAPLFYIMFLYDKPDVHRTEPKYETLNLHYADDNTIVISAGLKDILRAARSEIEKMASYNTKWRIKINIAKSKILIFGKNKNKIEDRLKIKPITLLPSHPNRIQQNIPTASTHNILGILIDNNLSFIPCLSQLKATLFRNRCSFLRFIPLSHRVRAFLYKCYLQPKILYHYPIYSFLKRKQRLMIQSMQNNCLLHFIFTYTEDGRMKSEEAHVRAGLEAINHLCHKKAQKFYEKQKETHMEWHNKLVEWHSYPTRDRKILELTPMDWAANPVTRPIYTELS